MVLFNVYLLILIIPIGTSQDILCGKPGAPIHGHLTPKKDVYAVGEKITYGCKEKRYYLIGNVTRTCSANGTWSGSVPICGNNYGWHDVLNGTKWNCNRMHLVDNDKKTFCRIEKGSTITIDLFVSFTINTILFAVEPNTNCSLKLDIINSNDKDKIKTFRDNNNLKFVSKTSMIAKTIKVTFENDVTLYDIGVFYLIGEVLCGEPDIPNLVKFTNITSTKGKFSCPKTYALNGDANIHCINGEWNTTGLHCKLIEDVPEGWMGCGKPGSPSNGKRFIEDILDNKLMYACDKNFHLIGNPERTCQPNTFWTPHIPKCVKNLAKNYYITKNKTPDNGTTCRLQDTKFYGAIELGNLTKINSVQLHLQTRYPIEILVFVTNNSAVKSSTFEDVHSLTKFYEINNALPKAPIICNGSAVSAKYVVTYYSKPVNVCEIIVFNTKEAGCGESDQPLYGKVSSQNQSLTTFVCDSGYSMDAPNVANCVDGIWESPPLCSPVIFISNETTNTSYIPYNNNDDNNNNVVIIIGIAVGVAGVCILIIIVIVCRIKKRSNQNFENLNCHYKAGQDQDGNESDEAEHIYEAVKPPPVRTYTKQSCSSNESSCYLTPILPLKPNCLDKPASKCTDLKKQDSSNGKLRVDLCGKLSSSGSNDFCKAKDNIYS